MFLFKRAMMKAIVNGKKKREPFDFERAEAYSFPYDGDGTQNNSYYFSAHSFEKGESLYVRLGLRNNGAAEVWAVYCRGTESFVHKQNLYTVENSPLTVVRGGQGWSFRFEGTLLSDGGEELFAKMDCAFTPTGTPVDFFMNMPTVRVATAMAQDKWSKEYFAGISENNSVHYEQEGVLNGTLTLGGEQIAIDLPCLRDHSYGRRVWSYMNNHLWLAGVDKRVQFNFSMVSYPAMSVLEVGHLREDDAPVSYVTRASYDRNQIITGEPPKSLSLKLAIDGKREIGVEATPLCGQEYLFEGGAYRFFEGIAELTVNGKKCRGILEVGFNRDCTRFMNGKAISAIKE